MKMEIETPKQFFEEELPKRFRAEKSVGVDVIVQLSIDGPHGGNWTVIIKNQKMTVGEGTHASPTLSVKMTERDYMDVINNKTSGEKAFMTGKLQLKGSITLALKLKDMGFM